MALALWGCRPILPEPMLSQEGFPPLYHPQEPSQIQQMLSLRLWSCSQRLSLW